MKRVFIFVLLSLLLDVDGKKLKILVNSPNLGYSHLQFQGKIADILVEAGHEVHVFIPMWDKNELRNGTFRAHKVIRYDTNQKTGLENVKWVQNQFDVQSDSEMVDIIDCISNFMTAMLSDTNFILSMKSESYDIGIADGVDTSMYGLFEILGIPRIVTTVSVPMPDGVADLLGIPLPRAYVPCAVTSVTPVVKQPMGFRDRLMNLYAHFSELVGYYRPLHRRLNQVFSVKYGQGFPKLSSLLRNSLYVFSNTYKYVDQPKPLSNRAVFSGGIVMEQVQSLDEDVHKIFLSSKTGVILFSLGSITNTTLMPYHIKILFLETFKTFPDFNFIMKSSIDQSDIELFANYPNVYTLKWIDQKSILAHPKLSAFITHAGLNSINEAVKNGVPMITIPLFGDQKYNAAMVLNKNLSTNMVLSNITINSLTYALNQILYNKKYEKALKSIKTQLSDQIIPESQQLVRLIEITSKKRLDILNLKSSSLDFVRYFYVDTLLLIAFFIIVLEK